MAASAGGSYLGVQSDLRRFSPPAMRQNQWRTSTCVAQSSVRAVEIKRVIRAYEAEKARGSSDDASMEHALGQHVDLSRLMLYFMSREMMNPPETNKDDGTFISFAAEAFTRYGVSLESDWPWDERMIFTPPTWGAVRGAFVHKVKTWNKIYSRANDRVNDCILSLSVGNPVVYGTVVGRAWQQYDGSKPLDLIDGVVVGSHATVLVGWDPTRQLFIGENSWGTGWGLNGFYEIKPDVIASTDSSDFVTYYGGWEGYLEQL